MYIEERTWYQKAGDWIYNTFCVDLANKWDRSATEIGENVESITVLGKFSKFTSIYDKFGSKGSKTISSWVEDGVK